MERILGAPFHSMNRAADMLCLNLGETVERFFPYPRPDGQVRSVPAYSIHLQTQWRFVRNGRIVLASRDMYEPFAPDQAGDDWAYDLIGRPAAESSRFDVLSPSLSRRLRGSTVTACRVSPLGDLMVEFSSGILFASFTPSSLREELWRLVDCRTGEHLVFFEGDEDGPELVIRTLEELSGWLGTYPVRREIDRMLNQLEHWLDLNEAERKEIKRMLSRDMLFHVRWLGDVDVPGFVGDGTSYAWWNYLSNIAEICQNNL